MPRLYCDHNFLIGVFNENEAYRLRLQVALRNNDINLVLSPWHWVEMAEDNDRDRGIALAQFADWLAPGWLRERRNLQQNEVAHGLSREMGLPYRLPEPITTLRDVIVEMTSIEIWEGHNLDSAAFVRYLQTAEGRTPLLIPLLRNFEAQRANRLAYQAGAFTRQIRRQIQRRVVDQLLPEEGPDGQVIPRRVRREFVRTFREQDYPSICVETALSSDALELDRALTSGEFRDRQHANSLPYVDEFVTDDRRLRNTIRRIATEFAFNTAGVVSKAEFDQRYF